MEVGSARTYIHPSIHPSILKHSYQRAASQMPRQRDSYTSTINVVDVPPRQHLQIIFRHTRTQKVSNMAFDLGENIFLYARTFRGKRLIHVRQYNRTKNGRKYPTKTGISMTPDHFESFVSRLQEINGAYEHVTKTEGEYRNLHFMGGLHVSMRHGINSVDMVRFNMADNDDIAVSKFCITLPISVWKSLGEHAITLNENEQKLLAMSSNEPTTGEPPECTTPQKQEDIVLKTSRAPQKKRCKTDVEDRTPRAPQEKRRKLCFRAEA